MFSPNVPDDGLLEAHSSEPVVEKMIVLNRSRLDAATEHVDEANKGTRRVIHLVSAVGRVPLNAAAALVGQGHRAIREIVESYQDAVDGGDESENESTSLAA